MSKNVYKLYINIGGSDNGKGVIAGKDASEMASKESSAKKGVGTLTAYQVVSPFLNATKQMIANDVNTQYSNTELSSRVNIGMEVASTAIKTAVNVASGMSLASALGFSSPIGAIIGVVTTVAEKALNIAVKQNAINNQAKIESEQFNILRGRAGIQFNRSRVGE